MKKTAIVITIILNLICLCACVPQKAVEETETVEVTVKLEELLPKEVPDKMVFWSGNEEYIIEDAEVLEQLWGELLDMTARELVVEEMLEGIYSTDCYYGDKMVTFSIGGGILYFNDMYYEVGEELLEWNTEKKKAAGIKFD